MPYQISLVLTGTGIVMAQMAVHKAKPVLLIMLVQFPANAAMIMAEIIPIYRRLMVNCAIMVLRSTSQWITPIGFIIGSAKATTGPILKQRRAKPTFLVGVARSPMDGPQTYRPHRALCARD
jgi:hypothetical protein